MTKTNPFKTKIAEMSLTNAKSMKKVLNEDNIFFNLYFKIFSFPLTLN